MKHVLRQKNGFPRAMTKALTVIMAGSMTLGNSVVFAENADMNANTLLSKYLEGDSTSSVMARFWFPDAGAGYDADGDGRGDYIDQVADMITDMVDQGFGGCELTMLLDSADYAMLSDEQYAALGFTDAEDAIAKIGWGSEAWANIIACATDTANRLNKERGTDFHVDVTITAHWPMIINNVDPNEDAQQQQLVYTTQEVTAKDLAEGVDLLLPEMKTSDAANSSAMQSTYIFKDTLVSSTLVKSKGSVTEEQMDFMGNVQTIVKASADFQTLSDVTAGVSEKDGYKAGVPYADAKFMKMGEDGQWIFYKSADEIDPSYEEAADYVVLQADSNKLYAPNDELSVSASVGFGGISYTVENKTTGESVANESISIIDKGSIVVYSTDADGDSCCDAVVEDGLITISNRKFLGDRAEMQDTQKLYSISAEALSAALEGIEEPSNGNGEIEDGEYELVNVYRRGTGQVASGGGNIPMTNKTYAVDYFSEDGAAKVIEYWEDKLLPHVYTREDGSTATLREIMEENEATIFEDSIELSHTDGNLWTADMLDDLEEKTGLENAILYMPLFAGFNLENDNGEADRITQDLKETMNALYTEEHLGTISNWTNTFGYGFRTQCHGIDAVDSGSSALSTDIAESDNATDGFGTRAYAGAKNVNPDNNVMSNESLTFGTGFGEFPSWYRAENTLNRYYSEGINRVIFHGTPFKQSFTKTRTADCEWPGWDFMSFMAWNSRQTWWDDATVFTNYTDRVQAILQNGQSKIPAAILEDPSISSVTSINAGVQISKAALQQLIGNGYNYNIITRGLLEQEEASLDITTSALLGDTVLSEMAEFQVLILDHISSMSVSAMEKLVTFAEAGLNIIDMGSTFAQAYGTETDASTDAQIAERYAKVQSGANYHYIADDAEDTGNDSITASEQSLLDLVAETVTPAVSYSNAESTAVNNKGSKWLEATRIYDEADGSNYYLLYNESGISVGAEQSSDFGPAFWEENGDITTTITLAGNGAPYLLDPTTGEVKELVYTAEDNKVTFDLTVQEGDLIFVLVTDSEEAVAAAVAADPEKEMQTRIELGGDTEWQLALTSFVADRTEENMNDAGYMIDPTKSTRLTVDKTTKLVSFAELDLSGEELEALGRESADKISGIGEYTITVDVPEYDAELTGGILNYTMDGVFNCVTRVTVQNSEGTVTEYTGINANHSYLDLGSVLTAGENTITIRVCTDMTAAAGGSAGTMGFGGGSAPTCTNGITDASLDLYTVK